MEKFKCRMCGSLEDTTRWTNGPKLEEKQLCFSCNFWDEIVPSYNKGEHFVDQNNGCYVIGNENPKATYFRGFGGAKTTITFNDGRIVKSTNLWFRGDVPEHFKTLLPPNAQLEWKQ